MNEKTFATEIPDEKITGRWLCLWPNGTRSIVFDAYTIKDAINVLDDLGDAKPHMLHPIEARTSYIDFVPEVYEVTHSEDDYRCWNAASFSWQLGDQVNTTKEERLSVLADNKYPNDRD